MEMAIKWKEQITIPNILTSLRLLAIPWMAVEIYRSEAKSPLSTILFLAIWFTDVLDGWIARHFDQVSELGKVFDPAVDKIFQLTTAIMLTIVGRVPLWIPIAIAIKDLILIIGGLVLMSKDYIVSAKWIGKLNTVLLVVYFVMMFFLPDDKLQFASILFIPVLITMLLSLIIYVRDSIKLLKSGEVQLKKRA